MACRPVRTCRAVFIVPAVLAWVGCTAVEPPGPVPEHVRREMGRVGVGIAPAAAAPQLRRPWVKSNAGFRGALAGAGKVLGAGGAAPQAAGMAALLSPVGATVGAIAAPLRAKDDAVVRRQAALIESAAAAMRLDERVRDDFLRHAFTETAGTARVTSLNGPRRPPGAGPDTVLELTVDRFGLDGPDAIDPPLTPYLSVRGRLVRAADGQELYSGNWSARGRESKSFAQWAAAGEAGLSAAFEPLRERTTRAAVNDVFVFTPVP